MRKILLTLFSLLFLSGCSAKKVEFVNNSMLQGEKFYIEFVDGDKRKGVEVLLVVDDDKGYGGWLKTNSPAPGAGM